MKDYPTSKEKVDLRLPEGMRKAVAEYGKNNGRSMNAQIVQFIEDGLGGIDATTMAQTILNIQEEIKELKQRVAKK